MFVRNTTLTPDEYVRQELAAHPRLAEMAAIMDYASLEEPGTDEWDWDMTRLQTYSIHAAKTRLAQYDTIQEAITVFWACDIDGKESGGNVPLVGIEGEWWAWENAVDVEEQLSLEEQKDNALELQQRIENPTCSCENPWCELGF